MSAEAITEHLHVPGPLVYGYLDLPWRHPPSLRTALGQAVSSYCQRHELHLAGVFTDRRGRSVNTAAFAGLLDALAVPGSYGVVIPSPSHLGRHKDLAHRRATLITRTGARLLVIRHSGHTTARSRFPGRPQC